MTSHPEIMNVALDTTVDLCRKDTGERRKLRLWSRGHVFFVRSCGFVDMWRPIYRYVCIHLDSAAQCGNTINAFRSESPSQVFLIVITWLYETLSKIEFDKWTSVILAYDNMCHLDGLRAARCPLPLPKPYDSMWTAITKVIVNI